MTGIHLSDFPWHLSVEVFCAPFYDLGMLIQQSVDFLGLGFLLQFFREVVVLNEGFDLVFFQEAVVFLTAVSRISLTGGRIKAVELLVSLLMGLQG